jgi:hypothetical protein
MSATVDTTQSQASVVDAGTRVGLHREHTGVPSVRDVVLFEQVAEQPAVFRRASDEVVRDLAVSAHRVARS